jgi:hypothetical protein
MCDIAECRNMLTAPDAKAPDVSQAASRPSDRAAARDNDKLPFFSPGGSTAASSSMAQPPARSSPFRLSYDVLPGTNERVVPAAHVCSSRTLHACCS